MDDYKVIENQMANKYGGDAGGTKKAIGDFFLDNDQRKPVNVKSNNTAKANYSPNIISAKRLIKWLEIDGNELFFLFVNYHKDGSKIVYESDTGLIPVHHLSWNCLTIEAQGWGVIQMHKVLEINPKQTKKEFYSGFRAAYEKYMVKEEAKMAKIREMIKSF